MFRRFSCLVMLLTMVNPVLTISHCSEDEADQEEIIVDKPDLEKEQREKDEKAKREKEQREKDEKAKKEREQKEKEEEEKKQREKEEQEQRELEELEKKERERIRKEKEEEEKKKKENTAVLQKITSKVQELFATEFANMLNSDYEVDSKSNLVLSNILNETSEQKLTKSKPFKEFNSTDKGVQFLQNAFKDKLKSVNSKVVEKFKSEGYYGTTDVPITLVENVSKATGHLVDVTFLQKVASKQKESLKVTRLAVEFSYKVSYKNIFSDAKKYQQEILITNDLKYEKDVEKKVIMEINRILYDKAKDFQLINDDLMKNHLSLQEFQKNINAFNLVNLKNEMLKKLNDIFQNEVITKTNAEKQQNSFELFKAASKIENTNSLMPLNISDLDKIWVKVYKGSVVNRKSEFTKKYPLFLEEVKQRLPHIFNSKSFEFFKTKIDLSEILFAGLRLKGILKDPIKSEELTIKFVISNEILQKEVESMVYWAAKFADFYGLAFRQKILLVSENEFNIYILVPNSLRTDIKYGLFEPAFKVLVKYFEDKGLDKPELKNKFVMTTNFNIQYNKMHKWQTRKEFDTFTKISYDYSK